MNLDIKDKQDVGSRKGANDQWLASFVKMKMDDTLNDVHMTQIRIPKKEVTFVLPLLRSLTMENRAGNYWTNFKSNLE